MGITRDDVKKMYDDMITEVKSEDEKAERDNLYRLYKGMSDSMQQAVKDIMLVQNGEYEE